MSGASSGVLSRSGVLALLGVLTVLMVVTGCRSGSRQDSSAPPDVPDERPVIVVTYPVLGAVVSDLVGDAARVEVLMPPGADPHDYEPSARDAETVAGADLVVVNGLDLEERLVGVVEQAAASGVPVFAATDHLVVRERADGHEHAHGEEAQEDEHGADDEHGYDDEAHGALDPHFWTDPVAMGEVVAALAPVVQTELGIDVAARAAELETELAALDAEVREQLAAVPDDRRVLVTAHESLGWFADRYDFELLGALVSSLTSQAQASAADLSELAEEVEHHDVPAIFLEIGTPASLAEAIADQTGVRVIELQTHTLPPSGSYVDFVRGIAAGISEGLAPS